MKTHSHTSDVSPASALKNGFWSPAEDAIVTAMYYTHTRQQIAARLNRTKGSVRSRCWTLGLNDKHTPGWSADDTARLQRYYEDRRGRPVSTKDLEVMFPGRDRCNICRKARELGLTDKHRQDVEQRKPLRKHPTDEESRKATGEATKQRIALKGHPRGALGIKHSAETRIILGEKSRAWAKRATPEEWAARAGKMMKTKMERYGTAAPRLTAEHAYSRARRGRRDDLGETYFRSAWEANWARYLNLLIAKGHVVSWEYEPDTFTFSGEIRGVISYTPDFRVTDQDGLVRYEEVKGWTTSKDRTKWKRMKEHYPDIRLDIIDQKVYAEVEKKVAPFIKGWEYPGAETVFSTKGTECSEDGCSSPSVARGLCGKHYQRVTKAHKAVDG